MAIDKTIKLKVDSKDAVKGIDQVEKGVKGVDKSAKGAKSGLARMTGAAKGLGVAFKALGIGLIVAAFMKLKEIFSGNIETARRFERIAAQVSAAFDVLRDRAEDFIKSLIALKNPFKAFKDAFKGTTAEIREEVKAIDKLTIALQGVRDEERDMLLIRAKANKIIAESRLLAEDDTKSMVERLAALKAAVAEEKRVADMEVATQKKKVDTLQAIIDLGKSSEEDIANLAAERARLIDLQTASVLKQKRVAAEIGTFTNQIAKEEERIEKERLARIELTNQARELNLEVTAEITNKEIEALIKAEEKRLGIEQKAADDLKKLKEKEAQDLLALEKKKAEEQKKIKEQQIAAVKAMEIQGAQSILGSLGQLAGEGTKLAKATALANILINSAQGVSAAIKAGAGLPFPANLGAIATGVAAVLSGIVSAKAIFKKVKTPGGGGGGGDIDVSATSAPAMPSGIGGEGLIPNLEGIEATALGEPQPVQAYVVENDISNAQALQQELDTQATL
tara:strand:- start:165 stop:1688 length:1524 start_codon:yes stop_codon:yes gene_type:complete